VRVVEVLIAVGIIIFTFYIGLQTGEIKGKQIGIKQCEQYYFSDKLLEPRGE
jgi:hypothetical protein